MEKEYPKNASQHKEHIAKLASQIDDLMSKMEKIEKSKKNVEKVEDKKSLEESILGTIALGATLGMGVNWLKNKKKQIAAADQRDQEEKEQAKKDQERLKKVEDAKAVLEDPNNKQEFLKIKNDNEIKTWIKTIDTEYNNLYNKWVDRGGYSTLNDEPPPAWGDGSDNLIKNIENKIVSLVGAEKATELLGALKTSGKGLDTGLKNEKKQIKGSIINSSSIGSNKESRAIGMWAQSKGLSQEDFDELDMLLEAWFNITQNERDDSRSM
jgi:hypothetical protein